MFILNESLYTIHPLLSAISFFFLDRPPRHKEQLDDALTAAFIHFYCITKCAYFRFYSQGKVFVCMWICVRMCIWTLICNRSGPVPQDQQAFIVPGNKQWDTSNTHKPDSQHLRWHGPVWCHQRQEIPGADGIGNGLFGPPPSSWHLADNWWHLLSHVMIPLTSKWK